MRVCIFCGHPRKDGTEEGSCCEEAAREAQRHGQAELLQMRVVPPRVSSQSAESMVGPALMEPEPTEMMSNGDLRADSDPTRLASGAQTTPRVVAQRVASVHSSPPQPAAPPPMPADSGVGAERLGSQARAQMIAEPHRDNSALAQRGVVATESVVQTRRSPRPRRSSPPEVPPRSESISDSEVFAVAASDPLMEGPTAEGPAQSLSDVEPFVEGPTTAGAPVSRLEVSSDGLFGVESEPFDDGPTEGHVAVFGVPQAAVASEPFDDGPTAAVPAYQPTAGPTADLPVHAPDVPTEEAESTSELPPVISEHSDSVYDRVAAGSFELPAAESRSMSLAAIWQPSERGPAWRNVARAAVVVLLVATGAVFLYLRRSQPVAPEPGVVAAPAEPRATRNGTLLRDVALRTQPNSESAVEGKLTSGTRLRVYDVRNSYLLVIASEGQTAGFVPASAVVLEPAPPPVADAK